ncbi:MAG: OmpW family outer membrane protein [Methylotenera sp.]|nr:OmpW family outer membrane protein [Methylotenera sp.]MDP1754412.1 OmpW family outer membrane protein [Methylotenera sp.]MDP1959080.1 OmpW family outer membrane protein [Methylotenera sp.]MDP3942434.1 OmpW family outer membrane protein [Methylotenera sp.]
MKKSVLVLAIAATFAPVLAQAEAGDWVVRLRATNINPSESSKLGETTDKAALGASAAALYGSSTANLEVDSNTIPELDISYYVTKNIALELILALGSKHDVNVSTTGLVNPKLGEVNLLPPTLTAQWHFMPDQTFDPYVGAGVTYARAMDNGLTANATASGNGVHPIRIDRNNWGVALQAGFDINLTDRWLVNFDVKKIWIDTDVKLNFAGQGYKKIDSLDIDPLVVSVGIGKKF